MFKIVCPANSCFALPFIIYDVSHFLLNQYYTSQFKPWKIKTAIAFDDREKAIHFEKYLKSHSGRAFVKKHF
jgi:hypothetical protein